MEKKYLIKLKYLPDDCYFWRSGFPQKWYKISSESIVDGSKPAELLFNDIDEEVVLFQPRGIIEDIEMKGKFFSFVQDWTTNPNPHL